jgi:uncharacterized RDD family membrane protein YckC
VSEPTSAGSSSSPDPFNSPAMAEPTAPSHAWAIEPEVAPGPAPGYVYVGFWQRVIAWFIDGLILGLVDVVLIVVAVGIGLSQVDWSAFSIDPGTGHILTSQAEYLSLYRGFFAAIIGFYGLTFLLFAGYFVLLWWLAGGTIGQRLMGMEIRTVAEGRRVGFWRSCLRFVGLLISWWAFGIGLLWVGIDDRKQGWHDKIASTFVVKRG